MRRLVKPLATAGYIGYLKPPGTLASAAAVAAAFLLRSPAALGVAAALTLALGLAICKPAIEELKTKDPSSFVLDEWCGMTIALLFVPLNPWTAAAGFVLFRFFDVVKPLGVRALDEWDHPWSIMLDDVLAGLYANVLLQAAVRLASAP